MFLLVRLVSYKRSESFDVMNVMDVHTRKRRSVRLRERGVIMC